LPLKTPLLDRQTPDSVFCLIYPKPSCLPYPSAL
jgi:hypothetical protein